MRVIIKKGHYVLEDGTPLQSGELALLRLGAYQIDGMLLSSLKERNDTGLFLTADGQIVDGLYFQASMSDTLCLIGTNVDLELLNPDDEEGASKR
jgi:hypothetical protein